MSQTFQYRLLNYEIIDSRTCNLGVSNNVHGNGAIDPTTISGDIIIPSVVINSNNSHKYHVISTTKFCFRNCTNITGCSLPNTLKIIEQDLFFDDSLITSLIIPSSVEILRYAALSGIYNLKTIIFESGSNLKSIGDSAFAYLRQLKRIVLPSKLKTLSTNMFFYMGNQEIDLYYCSSKEVTNDVFTGSSNNIFNIYVTKSYPSNATFGGKAPIVLDSNDRTCTPYINNCKHQTCKHNTHLTHYITLVFLICC